MISSWQPEWKRQIWIRRRRDSRRLSKSKLFKKHMQSYIAYLDRQHANLDYHGLADQHHELLASVLRSKEEAKTAIFYSYTQAINDFTAHIEEEHALSLADRPEVLSLFLNEGRKLHIIFSWKFMGLEQGAIEIVIGTISSSALWKKTNFERDVIIANLDTGVWLESASFDDRGFGLIAKRWKGISVIKRTFMLSMRLGSCSSMDSLDEFMSLCAVRLGRKLQ